MSIFGSKIAYEAHEERLKKLEHLCDDLERADRGRQLEYIELYDKVRHQMSRMSKRYAVDTRERIEEIVVEDPPDGVDEISAKILALRGTPRNVA